MEEAVLINTAGGVAGGDRLELCVTALPGASIAVTSQAAEKVYRALNEPARVATRLKARESARLAWLPQETIVFNWARLHRTTEIELFYWSRVACTRVDGAGACRAWRRSLSAAT